MQKAKRSTRKVVRKVVRRKPQSTAIVHVPVAPERPWELNEEAVTILKNSVAKGASDEELKYCLTVARRYRLDPFKQQIWFIKRWDKNADNGQGGQGAYLWVPQVGIYGLLHIAARDHKDYAGMSEVEYGPMITIEVETKKIKGPEWARVKVWKKGSPQPTVGEAYFEEYCPKKWENTLFWRTMPRRMIAKCAKAQGVREACPDLGGLKIPEEMERMNDGYTPGGRQIVEGAQNGSHEAAQRVLSEKLASGNPNPIEPEIVASARPASQEPPSQAVPRAQIPPREWRGTVEIDWSADKAFPRVLGDIAEVAAHFPKDLVLKRKDDFWHAFSDDVPRIKAVCDTQNFKVIETSAPAQSEKTTAQKGSGSGSGIVAPAVVSGIIERCNAGMAGKYPVRQVTLLLADKTKPTYSCFDKALFEHLDAGLGKQSELVVKQNGKYFNITGLRKIGSKEWDADGTPVIQRKDQEAGAKTLF